jgi:hypothetical protein
MDSISAVGACAQAQSLLWADLSPEKLTELKTLGSGPEYLECVGRSCPPTRVDFLASGRCAPRSAAFCFARGWLVAAPLRRLRFVRALAAC